MTQFLLPGVGALDFPVRKDGYWDFHITLSGREVALDINTDEGVMTQALLDEVQGFVVDATRFDIVARAAIEANIAEDPEGSSSLYFSHHFEEFSDAERLAHFGTSDVKGLGADQLLKSIHLKRIGLYPGSHDYRAVFDYTIDEDATDYVLAVEFSVAGSVVGISMES